MNNTSWVRYARQASDFIKRAKSNAPAPGEDRLIALEDAQRYLGMAIHELRLNIAHWQKKQAEAEGKP